MWEGGACTRATTIQRTVCHTLVYPILFTPLTPSSLLLFILLFCPPLPFSPSPSYDFYQNKKETHIGSRSDRFLKLLELQVRATL